jgi:hypothetical protein
LIAAGKNAAGGRLLAQIGQFADGYKHPMVAQTLVVLKVEFTRMPGPQPDSAAPDAHPAASL